MKTTAGKLGGEKGSDEAVLDEWKEVVRSGRLEGGNETEYLSVNAIALYTREP